MRGAEQPSPPPPPPTLPEADGFNLCGAHKPRCPVGPTYGVLNGDKRTRHPRPAFHVGAHHHHHTVRFNVPSRRFRPSFLWGGGNLLAFPDGQRTENAVTNPVTTRRCPARREANRSATRARARWPLATEDGGLVSLFPFGDGDGV